MLPPSGVSCKLFPTLLEDFSMRQKMTGRLACWTTLTLLGIASLMVAQAATGGEGKTPVKKLSGRKGHRLPSHYGAVVDEKQREEIYKIQDEYQPKIDILENQLKALKKERDDKISAVLTAEQKKKLDEATAKQKPRDAKPVKPAEEEPPSPPAKSKPAK
jgi:hypothetical protein